MILIAIQHTEKGYYIAAADTYVGASTQLSAEDIGQAVIQLTPILQNWAQVLPTYVPSEPDEWRPPQPRG